MSVPFAGSTPASAFTEITFGDPDDPPIILADAIDPQTNEYRSLERSLDPVDSAVIVALSVARDSAAALVGIGHRFADIRYAEENVGTLSDSYAREALGHLTRAGVVEILRVRTESDGSDEAANVVEYRNIPAADERISRITT